MAPTVVFLHGFTHTGRSWQPVIAALAERYTSVADDIRGHGDASERLPVSLGTVVDDVLAAAPERFTLAGYSMGGRIALHVALRRPDRVQRLVLIGASPGIADAQQREARRLADERLADEVEALDHRGVRAAVGTDPVLAGLPPEAWRPRKQTGCARRRRGWRERCAGWARARYHRCGTGSASWRCRSPWR